jgi:rhodanese-related sulfurtransferase
MSSDARDTQRIKRLVGKCYTMYPDVPWLSVDEFLRQSQRDAWLIVDCRPPRERRVSVIPGSMSSTAFEAEMEQHREENLLIYCTVGCRSGVYAHALREKGFAAFNLWGGVLAWALNDGAFVTLDGQTTRQVHVHGRSRHVLPPGYEAVGTRWFKLW